MTLKSLRCSICDREMEVVSLAGGMDGAEIAHMDCAILRVQNIQRWLAAEEARAAETEDDA